MIEVEKKAAVGLRHRGAIASGGPAVVISESSPQMVKDFVTTDSLLNTTPMLSLERLARQTLAMAIVKPANIDNVNPVSVWYSLGGSNLHDSWTMEGPMKSSDCLDGTSPFATYDLASRKVNIAIAKDIKGRTLTAQIYDAEHEGGASDLSPFSADDKFHIDDLFDTFTDYWSPRDSGQAQVGVSSAGKIFSVIDSRIEKAAHAQTTNAIATSRSSQGGSVKINTSF